MAKIPFKLLEEDLHGWNGDSVLFKELIDKVNPKTIIEVGSWKGLSTINMAKNSKAKIYCVDTWEGSLEFPLNEKLYDNTWNAKNVFDKFMSNCFHNGVLDQIVPIKSLSKDAEVPMAEMIYIDGDHTYQGVKEDLNKYWENLKVGGVMFGDDYFLRVSAGRPDGYVCGVQEAVDEFAKQKGLQLETAYNNFWILWK
jgi:predicted O-methyltransferase YrrM